MTLCRLNRIYYPVRTLGYGQRLGIWVQGCGRDCPGCMSPEMQPYEGALVPVDEVVARIPPELAIDGLTISGGEPFDQPQAVKALVSWFRQHHGSDILIYTGYRYEELVQRGDEDTLWVLEHIAALVDGPYVQELNMGKGLKGSENQCLRVFDHHNRYQAFNEAQRTMQCVDEGGNLFFIGVLAKDSKKE
ncbi:MAG: 4Fe-4S cluster-binding domain-containing protein [Clostridia bacterium]|nr:4Fe-4S cluster-binding domain-containing protein [Clostridia bacterium]